MKKVLMMAVAALSLSMPAMATEDSAMHKNEKVEMKTNHFFGQADTNKDGMISKSEHDAFGNTMFTDADANKDGSLSMDEVKAEKKKEMDKMEAMKPQHGND